MRPRAKISLAQVRGVPGYDGQFEQGFREVDDPYEPGQAVTAAVNIRHDVLMFMLNRKAIDLAEYAAGQKFRALMERAGLTGAKAVDFSREPVDGQAAARDMAVPAIEAAKELARAFDAIGADRYRVVWQVVGFNSPEWFTPPGERRDWRARKRANALLKLTLNELAKLWGFA